MLLVYISVMTLRHSIIPTDGTAEAHTGRIKAPYRVHLTFLIYWNKARTLQCIIYGETTVITPQRNPDGKN